MPIYEFECLDCGSKTTALVLSRARAREVLCRRCGSANLSKLFSRFATPKSEEARLDAMSDPSSFGDLDENDPASVSRWMKKMGSEMGEDVGDLDEGAGDALAGEENGAGSGDDDGDL